MASTVASPCSTSTAPISRSSKLLSLPTPGLYRPLSSNTGSARRTRLLTLAPGSYQDPIEIKLTEHNIEEDLTQYEALSYVWGDEMHDFPATVNDCRVWITENLNTALRHLRFPKPGEKDGDQADAPNNLVGEEKKHTGNRVMWIDALCIDQTNISERNHQVKLMGQIYHTARRVVVWLGPTENHSDFVMDCISAAVSQGPTPRAPSSSSSESSEADASTSRDPSRTTPSASPNSTPYDLQRLRTQSVTVPLGHMAPENEGYFIFYATELLKRAWFERVWVVQEVACSASAIIQCGNRIQPLPVFLDVFKILMEKWCYLRYEYNTSLLPADLHPGWYELCGQLEKRQHTTLSSGSSEDIKSSKVSVKRDDVRLKIIGMLHDFIELFVSALGAIDSIKPARHSALPFPHAVLHTEERQASDPRDKVFALLGMCQKWWDKISLTPGEAPLTADYQKDTATVYAEAMVVILKHGFRYGYPRLPLRIPNQRKISGLPSWVPDLSICRQFVMVAECHLSDAIDATPFDPSPFRPGARVLRREMRKAPACHQAMQLSGTSKVLHAQGVMMGTVVATCYLQPSLPEEDPRSGKDRTAYRSEFIRLLQRFFADFEGPSIPTELILKALVGPTSQTFRRVPFDLQRSLKLFEAMYGATDGELEVLDVNTEELDVLWVAFTYYAQSRMLFVTDTGRVGVSMGEVKEGDKLIGLFGIMYPFILKPVQVAPNEEEQEKRRCEGKEEEAWKMVNVAHVVDHELGHSCSGEGLLKKKECSREMRCCAHRYFAIV